MKNLNKELIFISDYNFGKTQNEVIKIGRKLYYIDIDKNSNSTFVNVYDYSKDRESFSKYEANLHFVFVENNSILDREFFKNIIEIEKATRILSKFKFIKVV